MPSRLRRCLLLLVLPLLAAGCGSSSGGDASTSTLLKDTFARRQGRQVRQARRLRSAFEAQGLPTLTGPLAFKLAGPFTSQGSGKLPKFDFDLDIAAGGQTIQAGAVSLGDTGYLKFGGHAYSVGKALFDQFKSGYEKSQSPVEEQELGLVVQGAGRRPVDAG